MTAAALLGTAPLTAQIPTPEQHFGFSMGTDKQLARWDEILEYFTLIADASDRIQVDTAGEPGAAGRDPGRVETHR
jgi:hypothetical protein